MKPKNYILLPEIDKEIILYLNPDDFINLMHANKSLKNLIIDVIPDVIRLSDSYEDLFGFMIDLLIYRYFDVIHKIAEAYENEDIYEELGYLVISQYSDNNSIVTKYFEMISKNYNWDNLIERLCNYYYISYFDELDHLDKLKSLNMLMRVLRNFNYDKFEHMVYDIFDSYKFHIKDCGEARNIECLLVKDIINQNNELLKNFKFKDLYDYEY